jgi:poly-gamma-glutamate synthesis protein (capsule biosynthesis protein)
MKLKSFLSVIPFLAVLCFFTSCETVEDNSEAIQAAAGENAVVSGEESDVSMTAENTQLPQDDDDIYIITGEQQENPVVRIVAAGDNLIHSSIYNQASARANYQGYDFEYAYQYVQDLFCGDLNIINQETLICNDEYEPSDYPYFNSPVALGDYMMDIGVNVFSIANNHMLDKGEDGLRASLDYWDSRSDRALMYGAYRNEEDMNNIRTLEVNGIKFAFVAFTEYTNGLSLPSDSELKIIYTSETELMKQQIQKAADIADCVIVSVHWGVEDTFEVDDSRKQLARDFVDWGANIIIGNHPHVIQSMEYIDNPSGGKSFVFYSLGNFISAQSDNFNMVELLADFNVTKDLITGEIIIDDIKAIPLINHYDYAYSNIRVYPYSMYTEELASGHGIHSVSSGYAHDFSMSVIDSILSENVPEQFLKIK